MSWTATGKEQSGKTLGKVEWVTDIPCESTPRTKAQTRSHSTLYILLIIKNQPLIILT